MKGRRLSILCRRPRPLSVSLTFTKRPQVALKKKNVQQYIINPNYSTPNYKPMGQDLAINLDAFINKTAVRPGRAAAARGSYAGRS